MFRTDHKISNKVKARRWATGFAVLASSAVIGTTGIVGATPVPHHNNVGNGYGNNASVNNNVNLSLQNIVAGSINIVISIIN